MKPENLAQPSPDAVTPDGTAQRLLDAPAEPAQLEAIGAYENSELAARTAPALAIHGVVFGAARHA
ncbi:MAG TPA: hypothetical protein VK757_09435, partial [Candidatus Acidoferrum sp.]|nr:hypothetical protein [Candidatus Acidoferrum sp.]